MTRYQVPREETYMNLTILANRSIDLFRFIGNHEVFNSTTIRTNDKMGKVYLQNSYARINAIFTINKK